MEHGIVMVEATLHPAPLKDSYRNLKTKSSIMTQSLGMIFAILALKNSEYIDHLKTLLTQSFEDFKKFDYYLISLFLKTHL